MISPIFSIVDAPPSPKFKVGFQIVEGIQPPSSPFLRIKAAYGFVPL